VCGFLGESSETVIPQTFLISVSDLSAATLIQITKCYILPGTTILLDCWTAYFSLSEEEYIRDTVNHSIKISGQLICFGIRGAHEQYQKSVECTEKVSAKIQHQH